MPHMFEFCSALEKIDLESLDTSNVTNMSYLFQDDYSLRDINIANFDMCNVIKFSGMFANYASLKKLDISNINSVGSSIDSIWEMLSDVVI